MSSSSVLSSSVVVSSVVVSSVVVSPPPQPMNVIVEKAKQQTRRMVNNFFMIRPYPKT